MLAFVGFFLYICKKKKMSKQLEKYLLAGVNNPQSEALIMDFIQSIENFKKTPIRDNYDILIQKMNDIVNIFSKKQQFFYNKKIKKSILMDLTKLVKKQTDKKIIQYAKKIKRYGKTNLDSLEKTMREIEREYSDYIRMLNLPFADEISKINEIIRIIEICFDYYFGIGNTSYQNAYDWINGNDNFKKLIA